MATFSRTIRSLNGDTRHARKSWFVFTAIVLTAWFGWFSLGKISVFQVSESARLEVTTLPHPVVAVDAGQVIATKLVLGKPVQAGELLIQLDDRAEQLALKQARARLDDLRARLKVVATEIETDTRALEIHQKSGIAAVQQQHALIEEAEVRWNSANDRLERLKKLVHSRAISQDAFDRSQAETDIGAAVMRAQQLALTGLEQKQQVSEADRQSRLAALERERVELAGQLAAQEVALEQAVLAVELRRITSPASGRIAQIREFPIGATVEVGEKLGFVVTTTEPHAVAFFPVTSAGRIQPGQAARIRLDGFPWVQYGSIPATVADVATEPQSGLLRVQLRLQRNPDLSVPVEHGLPGSAEVVVERVSPAVLVLRSAGWLLRSPAAPNRPRLASST